MRESDQNVYNDKLYLADMADIHGYIESVIIF